MKFAFGWCLHRMGWHLAALMQWLAPCYKGEPTKFDKACYKVWCLGGSLEGRGNEYMTGWR